MKATITVKRSGVETDETFEFMAPVVIGRFDVAVGPVDVDLAPLPEGAYVSRKHAQITYEDGAWCLSDLGSSNGTFILRDDFEKVDKVVLEDGNEFALGNAQFVFRIVQEPIEEATEVELTETPEDSSV